MNFNKTIPEMSANFTDRVVNASRSVPQRRPITLRGMFERANSALPVRLNWAVAVMAVFFCVGVLAGLETYNFADTYIEEIMEI